MTTINFSEKIAFKKTNFSNLEDLFLEIINLKTWTDSFSLKVKEWINCANNWNFSSNKDVNGIFDKYLW